MIEKENHQNYTTAIQAMWDLDYEKFYSYSRKLNKNYKDISDYKILSEAKQCYEGGNYSNAFTVDLELLSFSHTKPPELYNVLRLIRKICIARDREEREIRKIEREAAKNATPSPKPTPTAEPTPEFTPLPYIVTDNWDDDSYEEYDEDYFYSDYEDDYDVNDYDFPEDFYYDYADDFESYEDACDYFYEYHY